jgi:hypothetical protein
MIKEHIGNVTEKAELGKGSAFSQFKGGLMYPEINEKQLADDVLNILSDRRYNGRIVLTDLIDELRGGVLSVIRPTRWVISNQYDVLSIVERQGFSVTQKLSAKNNRLLATYISL